MLKTFDYECNNGECVRKGMVEERFIDSKEEDSQVCFVCGKAVLRLISAIRGYVKWTETPTRCK